MYGVAKGEDWKQRTPSLNGRCGVLSTLMRSWGTTRGDVYKERPCLLNCPPYGASSEDEPIVFGVHSEVAEHYGISPDEEEPHATTLDYVVAAAGG